MGVKNFPNLLLWKKKSDVKNFEKETCESFLSIKNSTGIFFWKLILKIFAEVIFLAAKFNSCLLKNLNFCKKLPVKISRNCQLPVRSAREDF